MDSQGRRKEERRVEDRRVKGTDGAKSRLEIKEKSVE